MTADIIQETQNLSVKCTLKVRIDISNCRLFFVCGSLENLAMQVFWELVQRREAALLHHSGAYFDMVLVYTFWLRLSY